MTRTKTAPQQRPPVTDGDAAPTPDQFAFLVDDATFAALVRDAVDGADASAYTMQRSALLALHAAGVACADDVLQAAHRAMAADRALEHQWPAYIRAAGDALHANVAMSAVVSGVEHAMELDADAL